MLNPQANLFAHVIVKNFASTSISIMSKSTEQPIVITRFYSIIQKTDVKQKNIIVDQIFII